MQLAEEVLKAITRMKFSGLKDYGRLPKDENGLVIFADVYADVLQDRSVRPETIELAAKSFCRTGGEFPTAGEFADECNAIRRQLYDSIGVEIIVQEPKYHFVDYKIEEGELVNAVRLKVIEVPNTIPVAERLAYASQKCLSLGYKLADAKALPAVQK